MAIDGRQKLQAKKDELTDELKQMEEEEDMFNQEEEGTSGLLSPSKKQKQKEDESQKFYENNLRRLQNHMLSLQKRNEAQRRGLL